MKTEKMKFQSRSGSPLQTPILRRFVAMLLMVSALFAAQLLLPDRPAYAYSEDDLYRIGLSYGSYAGTSYSFSTVSGLQVGTNEKSTGKFTVLESYPAGSYSVSASGGKLLLKNDNGKTLYTFTQSGSSNYFAAKTVASTGVLKADGHSYDGTFEFREQDGKVVVTNILPLNRYVMCVMPVEIYASWEVEMQKVFAVAVRTYAVSRRGFHDKAYGFDLCCKTCCQTYKGNDLISTNVIAGANATRGQILSYGGKVANINYTAISGGVTVKSSDAWGGTDYAYLDASPTPWENYGNHSPYTSHGKWTKEYSGWALYERLKDSYPALKGSIASIHIDSYGTNSGYATKVTVTDIYGNKATIERSDKIRTAFGLDSACFVVGKAGSTVTRTVYELANFPSVLSGKKPSGLPDVLNAKTVKRTESVTLQGTAGNFVFDGSGWGHGVGLSQYGAWDMVKFGYDYRTVLAYYFKNATIISMGDPGDKLGDVNGDGQVNATDRTILARYLAGWTGNSINLTAADMDCNGGVDAADRTYLARCLAGWEGYVF